MAKKADNVANRRLLVHCIVQQANEKGAPAGQPLTPSGGPPKDTTTGTTASKDKGPGKVAKNMGGKRVSYMYSGNR